MTRREAAIVAVLCLAWLTYYAFGATAAAAPTAQYLPCATIECVDGRLVAVLSRIDKAENEVRLAAEADRQYKAVTEQRMADIAWAKAGDRLDLFKRESAAYSDKWFYDRIYERWKVHACRSGVNMNATVRCP